jgi:spoIIIJ-associated protein
MAKVLREIGFLAIGGWSRDQLSTLFLKGGGTGWFDKVHSPQLLLAAAPQAPAPGPQYLAGLRYLIVMPIDDLQQAAQKIAGFLNSLNKLGGLRLKYRISATEGTQEGDGAAPRQISVELAGPDVPMVIQHNGELLRAIESLAAQMLRLDHHEHDMVSFDAANFKALRAEELRLSAEAAADKVRQTGQPYSFPPMNSRERRMLHMVCKSLTGIETASVGEGQGRFLVVYPEGKTDLPVEPQFKPRGFGRERRPDGRR